MSNPMKAAEDLKVLANRFRSILEVADVLEKIGSLEQAERDAASRKDRAYAEEKKAHLLLLDLDGKVALKQEAIKLAEEQAEEVVAKAKEKAQAVYAEMAEKNAAHLKQISELKLSADAAIIAKRLELDDVKSQVQAKKVELEEVSSQIAAVKSKLSSLFK